MAIKKGDLIIVAPGAEAKIEDGDTLIILSNNESLAKLPE
jgi:K+/H+ antiporter YhaU regulatory subunit KhtT